MEDQINKKDNVIDDLNKIMGEKNSIIDDLNWQRDDKQKCIDEHKRWLDDANNRANHLENLVTEKEDLVASMKAELEQHKPVSFELHPEDISEIDETQKEHANKVEELEELLRQARDALADAPTTAQIDDLNKTISVLHEDINQKNSIIDAVNKERDDARWSLGEHKQWLSESNNKVSDLENLLKDKDNELNSLRTELEEQKTVK